MGILTMFYDWPTAAIASLMFAVMLVADEIGYRLGLRNSSRETEPTRSVSNAIKASVFGLVALLLAFSFSATTARYDTRLRIVLDQANAIGTCYLRAGLLEDSARRGIRDSLRGYLKARIEQHRAGDNEPQVNLAMAEINERLAELWKNIEEANRRYPDAVRNSMIVPAANEVIDLSSTRAWANRNHLPDSVLLLLLASVLISSMLLGHSSGQSGRRHLVLWLATNALIALVLYVVIDFDRPRRGLIRVDQMPLEELYSTIGEGA